MKGELLRRIVKIIGRTSEGERSPRVAHINPPPEGMRGNLEHIYFWNSLFFWASLLYAFKYYLDVERANPTVRTVGPRPKKVLINNRLLDITSIEVSDSAIVKEGTTLKLKVEGQEMERGSVHLAGLVFEVEGELVLDLSSPNAYTTIECVPGKIIIDSEGDQ